MFSEEFILLSFQKVMIYGHSKELQFLPLNFFGAFAKSPASGHTTVLSSTRLWERRVLEADIKNK
jgi:hypothetical protein